MKKLKNSSQPTNDKKKVDTVQVSIEQKTVPLLPHERDQSTLNQVAPNDPVIEQAAKDIARGLTDTDRGEEVNRVYQKQKVKKVKK